MENGRHLGRLAMEYGGPDLVPVDSLPEETPIVTCAYVGSPAAKDICVQPEAYVRAVDMLRNQADVKIGGLISNECGGTATLNGWLQAAALGLPLVDAPCNGRAHPTGVMGLMGLQCLPGYLSQQAAAGGDPKAGRYVELFVNASLDAASALVRQAAVQAGGMVAAARNPVNAGYVRTHAAVGAIQRCIELGRVMLAARPEGGMAVCQAAARALDGEIVTVGRVDTCQLKSAGGFDVGVVTIGDYRLDFWNEYMTLERGSHRLATFPDLLATLTVEDGTPVTTAEVHTGQLLVILRVPRECLILGAGMFCRELYAPAEEILAKPLWIETGTR